MEIINIELPGSASKHNGECSASLSITNSCLIALLREKTKHSFKVVRSYITVITVSLINVLKCLAMIPFCSAPDIAGAVLVVALRLTCDLSDLLNRSREAGLLACLPLFSNDSSTFF